MRSVIEVTCGIELRVTGLACLAHVVLWLRYANVHRILANHQFALSFRNQPRCLDLNMSSTARLVSNLGHLASILGDTTATLQALKIDPQK